MRWGLWLIVQYELDPPRGDLMDFDFDDLTEIQQAILLSAFEDELEKIAIYKRESYVAGTQSRGEGFAGPKTSWGTSRGSGDMGIVGDRTPTKAGDELTLAQRNLLAARKKAKLPAPSRAGKAARVFRALR